MTNRDGYAARVLLDSESAAGYRLTTMEVTFPRFVLPEFNTHRALSKNSASSRAIPLLKVIERVDRAPFVPDRWWANQPGMTSSVELVGPDAEQARQAWLMARDAAVNAASILAGVGGTGVHKQQASRLLEPFAWHTVLVTGSNWRNFFALRTDANAQPELQQAVGLMLDAYSASRPVRRQPGAWHLPLIYGEVDPIEMAANIGFWRKVSVGRCARVSYLTHDGQRDTEKDAALHDSLLANGHMSPFEHVAMVPMNDVHQQSGNFHGWVQYRKLLPFEDDYSAVLAEGEDPFRNPRLAEILAAA